MTKYEVKGGSQIPISQPFIVDWKKNSVFHLFSELWKIQKYIKSNLQKSKNLFVNWEKTWNYSGTTA